MYGFYHVLFLHFKFICGDVLEFLKKVLLKIYIFLFDFLGTVLPKNKKLIIFESFLGKQYSDNPRAIYEYMVENDYNCTMYWSIDRNYIQQINTSDIKYVHRFSIKWLFLMTRAKYWVTNSRLPLWLKKPRGTKYIQTWHGTPLKKLAADMEEVHMPGIDTKRYKENFLTEASKWDYLLSPNAYSSEIFRRAFQFDKKMIESGYPRNDFLFNSNNEETINAIKRNCGLPHNKKIILYAPTWRDNQFYKVGEYKFNLKMDLNLMREKLGNDYIIILRLHYLVTQNLDLDSFSDFVYNLSEYDDIRDLYLISDILITDYSSVFFDYAILKRPIIFYVYDIEHYRDKLRGFYFDLEAEAPGPLVKTTQEIVKKVKHLEHNNFMIPKTMENFHAKFSYLEDGNSSERAVEEIWKGIG